MIFFDLDDTLLDFKTSEYEAVVSFYKEIDDLVNISEIEFIELWSQLAKKHYQRYLNGEINFEEQRLERVKEIFSFSGIELSLSECEEFFQMYLKSFEESWKLFDDVVPCLEKLEIYPLGIITNGDAEQQHLKLKRLGIIDYFDVIVTSGETGIAKPNARIFEIACERAGKSPQECIYIGDDLYTDILSCQSVNMKGIWLNRKWKTKNVDGIIEINSLHELIIE